MKPVHLATNESRVAEVSDWSRFRFELLMLSGRTLVQLKLLSLAPCFSAIQSIGSVFSAKSDGLSRSGEGCIWTQAGKLFRAILATTTAFLESANRRFDCNARCRLLLLVNIRFERGLIRTSTLMAGFIETAHRVYTAPLPLTRLPGELCDKFADSNIQMSVCVKTVNCPCSSVRRALALNRFPGTVPAFRRRKTWPDTPSRIKRRMTRIFFSMNCWNRELRPRL